MKIHLITNLFHPDELAGAALYTDFENYFRELGHDVRVTAAFSYYPAWKRRAEDVGVKWRDEKQNGRFVRRISMYIPQKPRGLTRLISDATFLFSILQHGKFRDWTPDVVVTACPMLSQCVAQRFLYRNMNVKRLIIVQDFVVDAALELGILQLPGISTTLRALERWALRSGDHLSTISPEMMKKLQTSVGADKPVQYIPNWVHDDLAAEIKRQEPLPITRETKTLFYSGNLGIKQGLPNFVDDFAALNTDWTLRIQGGGPEATLIKERTSSGGIVLGPVEDVSAYVTRLLQCTASLVTQRAGVSANFLPSKLLPALATHTPVLAVAEAATPLALEINLGGYGIVVPPGDQSALRKALLTLSDPTSIAQMSAKAAERSIFFSRQHVLAEYAHLLAQMTSP